MFSVIVTLEKDAWDRPGRKRFQLDRFGEFSEEAWAAVAKGATDRLARLNGVDALLLYESEIPGPHGDVVRVGHTMGVRAEQGVVTFDFVETAKVHRDQVAAMKYDLDLRDFEFVRTHWAIKDADLPGRLLVGGTPTLPTYDVVLSFASEERDYVEQVNMVLAQRGVSTFYDKDAEIELWGKDLAEHFSSIYAGQGRFCLMFVSRPYVEKMWTRHERRAALSHAMKLHTEYVLPVRFDDAVVPGLSSSIAYLNGANLSPGDLANAVLRKLGRR